MIIKAYIYLIVIFAISCHPPDQPIYSGQGIVADLSTLKTNEDVTAEEEENTDLGIHQRGPKGPVYTIDLNSLLYQVKLVSLTWQDYPIGKGRDIALSYRFPKQANYLEILRCHKTTVLSHTNPLMEIIPTNKETLQRAMEDTDYWAEALDKRCVMVHYGFDTHRQNIFLDESARTGDYYYVLRACVNIQRIQDRQIANMRNCSRFVTRSVDVSHQNNRHLDEIKKFEKLSKIRVNMSQSFHKMQMLGQKVIDAYEECDKKEGIRQKTVRKKAAIIQLVSLGLGAAISWTANPQGGLQNISNADYLSSPIYDVLSDFSSSPDDFRKSCYKGNEYLEKFGDEIRRYEEYANKYIL
ncbi:MAG: hypothetical protein OXC44_08430 [Proteobacteria bacterium]|nr:hypothetical protein [Pseudomonadota bacterium]